MLIRIVRMHFHPENVDEFLEIFQLNKERIRHFSGCIHLELLKDTNHPTIYTTLSHWNGPDDLENYRKSELFRTVWGQVKPLFSDRSHAFSLEKFIEL